MSNPPRIVAISTSSFGKESPAPLQRLMAAGFEVRPNPHGRTLTADEAKAHLAGVIGLVAGTEKLTGELLRQLPELKVISRVGTGMDNVDREAARALGIAVHNTPDAHVDAVAELTMAGLLSLLRGVPASDASIRNGLFDKPMGRLLRGKTVGMIGFGKVARALARLLAPWGTSLLATDVTREPSAATSLGAKYVELDELLAGADIVSLHLPYAKDAHHLIGAAQLAAMKPDAILVNTARGGLIDEAALVAHLEAHPKAGAYLDCFEKEPYQGGPLAKLKNVVLTSHIGSYAREARVRMETEAVDNLLKVLAQ
jgi:D-3-phosphoglycerate dehydrogenase / 2-oxoglutarate reductase